MPALEDHLPTGTVTFLFTDIEGSTRLVQDLGDAYPPLLEQHHDIVRSAVESNDGLVVSTEGDSFFAVFPAASSALRAAVDAELAIERHPWPDDARIRVRMGLHTGEGRIGAGSYVGVEVHRAARIGAAGHGGQVLVSASAAQLVERELPPDVSLLDLGEHRLKDLLRPERIFQVQHPALSAEFPPLTTLTDRLNNLPTQTSELVGRDRELREIRDLLADPGVRLLTLIGPGGIGKTRLAVQVGAEQADLTPDGVYFIDLSPVTDADAAFDAVARAIGASGTGGPLDLLRKHLATRRVLLVLDNLEQVMDTANGIAELLRSSSGLRVLVTSREALRIRGERLYAVPPLGLPDDVSSADAVARSEAGRLFVERARDVHPGFELTDEDAEDVAEICVRLDGLPLAIELAAARVALFSPGELRDRLREHAGDLGGGTRDLPERQQTLRSTIEWSERLLDEDERSTFRLFSVFATARIEAVEAVASRVNDGAGADVLPRLVSLVDKSLVRSLDEGGHRRLAMLQTIRTFAAERLDDLPEQRAAVRRAHAEHFADEALGCRERLTGRERAEVLAELEADLGNLRAAWLYWVEAGDLGRLDAMLDALWTLHDDRGWYHGAIELSNDLLSALAAAPATAERTAQEIMVRTSLARGLMAIRGYTQEVEDIYADALAQLEETGVPSDALPLLRSLASLYLYRGDFDKGLKIGRRLLELAELQQDPALQAEGHLRVGTNLVSLSEVDDGLEHLDRAIGLFDPQRFASGRLRLGPSPGIVPYTTSAFVLWSIGHPARAVERGASALRVAAELRHPYSAAYALFHVAFLDVWRRDWASVHERASQVRAIAEEHDYQVWRALALIFLGVSEAALGSPVEGMALSDQGIARYQDLTTPPVFWPMLLSVRARGFGIAGRAEEGLEPVEQAIELMEGRDNVLFPQLPLIKGDLLVSASGAADARGSFRHAFDSANAAGARMWQLRAATRLAELRSASGEPAGEERATLRSVYETFSEESDTPDIADARIALEGRG
ncbi:MAG TPA: adenylate/guanylate cyclase domain-containing protein [Actinomycetota bacterium]